MARIPERKFDPSRDVYARKPFIASGRKFVPGDLFDWRAAMVTPRRALQMFEAGKLTHNAPVTVEDKIEAVAPPLDQEVIVEDKDDLDEIEDMKELRRIADEIGAPYKVSKADQRQAIRDHRKEID